MPQRHTLPTRRDPTVSLLAALEQDRADLSASVHGGLVQSVLAARYLLDLLTPRAGTAGGPGPDDDLAAGDVRLQMLRDAVSAAVVEGRRLLARLKPGPGEHDLAEALASLADGRDDVHVQVTGTWPGSSGPCLPAGGATVLHRLVQAAVEHTTERGARLRVVAVAGSREVRVAAHADGVTEPARTAPTALLTAAGAGCDEGWGRRRRRLGRLPHRTRGPGGGRPGRARGLLPGSRGARRGAVVTSVLICDDHRIVREGLRQLLVSVPGVDRVRTAASGEEVLARFGAERPDLVLMDMAMPGLGGLETTRRLAASHPGVRVIMLTASDDRDQQARAIASGVVGYLLKDVSQEELCTAVEQALSGQDLIAPSLRRAMTERASGARSADPIATLTQRELQVLTGMSKGQSNAEIGRGLFLSEDTIKTHARRLFRKLGVNDRAAAVALGFRRGLVT